MEETPHQSTHLLEPHNHPVLQQNSPSERQQHTPPGELKSSVAAIRPQKLPVKATSPATNRGQKLPVKATSPAIKSLTYSRQHVEHTPGWQSHQQSAQRDVTRCRMKVQKLLTPLRDKLLEAMPKSVPQSRADDGACMITILVYRLAS